MKYKKVFLIDDDDDSNFLNTWIIKKEFSEHVESYQSAQSTLIYLKDISTDPGKLPDFIFLDLRMPLMDGFAFLKEFDKLPETVRLKCKIIILTSSFDKEDYLKAIKNKYVRGYLNKPLTLKALVQF